MRQESIKELKPYFEKNFPNVYVGTADLFVYFFERAMSLLKESGYFGFIVSNKFIRSGYGKNLRKYLQENFSIEVVVDKFKGKVFVDATVDPCIIVIRKIKPRKNHSITYNYHTKVPQINLSEDGWTFAEKDILDLKKKIENRGKKIKDWENVKIYWGIKSGFNKAFIINESQKNELIKKDPKCQNIILPILRGRDIRKYVIDFANLYLIKASIGTNIEDYPSVFEYLKQFEKELIKRSDYKKDLMRWYHLRPCAYYNEFEKPKIIYPEIAQESRFHYDNTAKYVINNKCYMVIGGKKSWTGLLNSKLMNWYIRNIADSLGKEGIQFKTIFMQEISIPENTESLDEDVDLMLKLQKEAQEMTGNTDKHARIKMEIEKLNEKIDWAVYKLYDLTDEEIAIIEK